MGNLNIGDAVAAAKRGERFTRAGWNGKGMWVEAQFPDENSKMTEPYLYMRTATGGYIPWLISQADVFAEDYSIID